MFILQFKENWIIKIIVLKSLNLLFFLNILFGHLPSLIAGLHEGDAAAVSGKQHREWRRRGVYTSGTAVCAAVSAAQMGANSAAQCRYEPRLHALFFQAAQAR